jgi:mannosyltransferase OCH1-like enzyme
MIPKIIHQVWIGDEMPKFCLEYTKELQKNYPDYEFKIWKEKDLKSLPSCKFLKVCNRDKHWGYSIDWYRAHILKLHGGIYLDIDVKFLSKIPETILKSNFILSLDNSHCVSNYIVGSPKNSRFIRNLIDIYKTYDDKIFSKVKWSAPEIYKKCCEKTFGKYTIYNKDNGNFISNNSILFIDNQKNEYFNHKVGEIEKYFDNE